MGNIGYTLPGLHMPQIIKVDEFDEFDEWIVWHEAQGQRQGKPCSSLTVAEADKAFYEQEGYTNVSIEKRHVEVMGERLW